MIRLISQPSKWDPEILSDPLKVTQPINRRARTAAPRPGSPLAEYAQRVPSIQPGRGSRVRSRENKKEPFISRLWHLTPRQAT